MVIGKLTHNEAANECCLETFAGTIPLHNDALESMRCEIVEQSIKGRRLPPENPGVIGLLARGSIQNGLITNLSVLIDDEEYPKRW